MLRATPWISYEPEGGNADRHRDAMDEDDTGDTPQISTLREEESPPPPVQTSPTRSKFRVKLLVNENRGPSTSAPPAPSRRNRSDEEEEEDEEDQLIDDDDEARPALPRITFTRQQLESSSPKKKVVRRRSKKQKALEEERAKLFRSVDDLADLPRGTQSTLQRLPSGSSAPLIDSSIMKPPRKKPGPRKKEKDGAAPRVRKPKTKAPTAIPSNLERDADAVSEGYTGTAASSPVTIHQELNSPEPEAMPSVPPVVPPVLEEYNFDGIPLPVYPLPTKPFPVQAPAKISSGFAPAMPLVKNNLKVRHWRVANREIRGIAGGRWFARSWVGDKESELSAAALAAQAAAAEKAVVAAALAERDRPAPMPMNMTLPGPLMTPSVFSASGSVPLGGTTAPSLTSAGPSSRAASQGPEPHSTRMPSKMRNVVSQDEVGQAAEEPPASDMAVDEPMQVQVD